MLRDIVIDTNVLVHSSNPGEQRFTESQAFLQRLTDGSTLLCVDSGFSINAEENRSHIGGEYLENVRFGTLAYVMIVSLATSMRIKEVSKRPEQSAVKQINQLVRKKSDRWFLGVARNSTEKVLVSHDFVDFQKQKRRTIEKKLAVRVIEAEECMCEV